MVEVLKDFFDSNLFLFLFRLVAAYEENEKLQKESESSKRKAENGYDRWIMGQGWGHINTLLYLLQNMLVLSVFVLSPFSPLMS